MPRALRHEYPGAVYHVMARGDGGKAIFEGDDDRKAFLFRIVADYIHLNPARAGLAGGRRGKLVAWKWSSLGDYARGKGPGWLVFDRLLAAFDLAKDGRGRRAYVAWLEERAADGGDGIGPEAMAALKRGWYLGEASFAEKLRKLVEGKRSRVTGADPVARSHDEGGAEELVVRALAAVGLPQGTGSLSELRKGDGGKILVAALLRKHTSAGNRWLAQRLAMGHTGRVSRLVVDTFGKNKANRGKLSELEKMLKCDT